MIRGTPWFGGGAVVMATGVVSLCLSLTGPQWLSQALFAVAAVAWAVLMAAVVIWAFTGRHRGRAAGSPSSLTLAAGTAAGRLRHRALTCWCASYPRPSPYSRHASRGRPPSGGNCTPRRAAYALGLVAYGMAVRRFDLRQILTGAGDQWVPAGGLAISTLAGSELWESSVVLGSPATTNGTLRALTLVVAASLIRALLCKAGRLND